MARNRVAALGREGSGTRDARRDEPLCVAPRKIVSASMSSADAKGAAAREAADVVTEEAGAGDKVAEDEEATGG